MPVLKNGSWTQDVADSTHQSSPMLAEWLKNYLNNKLPVIDFGCGNGFYLSELEKHDFICTGVEGFRLNNFKNRNTIIQDLTKPFDLKRRGSVLSLEVAEHLPKSAEQTFLDTITNHCNGDLIFSWALTGQPGVGHVNCVDQNYAISEIERRGFIFLPIQTQDARENIDECCNWFQRTMLIFKKK